jgi:enoyl-CoA hydratase
MPAPIVHWDAVDGVLHIRMARPPANALGAPLLDGLSAAVSHFVDAPEKVAVLSSDLPGFFVAGADIKHMLELTPEEFAQYRDVLRAPIERLAACGKPTIAAIDGLALGGGLELACACSLRFATPASRLGVPEVKLGLIPGAGGTQRLPRLVGRGRALEMTLTGDDIDATEAERIGLVDRLVAGDVIAEALVVATTMARRPASALAALLECADAADDLPHAEAMDVEGAAVVRMLAEGEAREGLSAFVDKRKPVFQ